MTSADMLSTSANLVRNRAGERREADPLAQLLVQLIARIGEPATVERAVSRPWASALFEGRRHVILLRVAGGSLRARRDALAHELQDAEWTLPGHFVADMVIDDLRGDAEGEWIELSALTIRDW